MTKFLAQFESLNVQIYCTKIPAKHLAAEVRHSKPKIWLRTDEDHLKYPFLGV